MTQNEKNTPTARMWSFGRIMRNSQLHRTYAEFRFLFQPRSTKAAVMPTPNPLNPPTPTRHSEAPAGPCPIQHNFSDVSHGSYYENAGVWALQNGVTSGIRATAFGTRCHL
jgi:hypothetical protein